MKYTQPVQNVDVHKTVQTRRLLFTPCDDMNISIVTSGSMIEIGKNDLV